MNYKILVVDDDELSHMTLELLFDSEESMVLSHAHSGPEALESIKNGHFDAIIMDYRMPEMTGAQATKEALKINSNLKIVINSGEDIKEIYNECINSGALDVIKKNSSELVVKIKKILSIA